MSDVLLKVSNVKKYFKTPKGILHAVDDVSFTIDRGRTLGVVGESGCGKSTTGRVVRRLLEPTAGTIELEGQDIARLNAAQMRAKRREMQMIFQDPAASLDPRQTVGKSIEEVFKINSDLTPLARKERTLALLEEVGLKREHYYSYPHTLSGGQKQRVGIARALATSPDILLCDEATSALDPKTTRSILSLLKKLNRELGVTVVVITHEMRVVEQICTRVAILDHGQIQETGLVAEVFSNPKSEAGRRLVLPPDEKIHVLPANRLVRLVFNGASAAEPIIATLAREQGILLNIISADTRTIGEKAFGNMILSLPEDETEAARALIYLREINGVTAEEVTEYVQ